MMDMIFSWNTLWWIMAVIYVPSCLGLIIIVLLQKGKGVGFAGAFGAGGGSDAVFGPRSSKSLPQRITYSMAGLFMLLALLMSMLSGRLGTSTAPELVDDTGMSSAVSAPAGSLGALFDENAPAEDAAPAPTETPAETPTEAPAAAPTETPEAAPAAESPAADAAPESDSAPAAEAPADTPAPEAAPAPEATPAPEAAAPADAAAPETPVEAAPEAEAPAAETPAAQ